MTRDEDDRATGRQQWRSPRSPPETGRVSHLVEDGAGPPRSHQSESPAGDLHRFRAILDRAGEAILIIDAESRRFVDANETALNWLRLRRDQLLSLCVSDLDVEFPLEPPQLSGTHLPDTRDSDRPWRSGEGVHRRRNGTCFPVEVEISRHRIDRGVYLLVVARESRDRRLIQEELRQAKEKFRALFDLSSDAIYLTSRDGTVVAANDAATEIFSFGSGIVGLPARLFYGDPADMKKFQLAIEQHGVARNHRAAFRRGDGSSFIGYITVTLRHAADGSILGYQCVVRPSTVGEPDSPVPNQTPPVSERASERESPVQSGPPREAVMPRTPSVAVHTHGRRSPSLPLPLDLGSDDCARHRRVWPIALLMGVVLSVLAWSDLAADGFPYDSGVGAWLWLCRFVGAGLLGIGVMGRQRVAAARTAAAILSVCAIGLLTLGIGHISQLPFGLAAVVPGASSEIWMSILSVSAFTLSYCALFLLAAAYLWRSSLDTRRRLLVT